MSAKYRVWIVREVSELASVVVEAESADVAEVQVAEQLDGQYCANLNWEVTDVSGQAVVCDVEEEG